MNSVLELINFLLAYSLINRNSADQIVFLLIFRYMYISKLSSWSNFYKSINLKNIYNEQYNPSSSYNSKYKNNNGIYNYYKNASNMDASYKLNGHQLALPAIKYNKVEESDCYSEHEGGINSPNMYNHWKNTEKSIENEDTYKIKSENINPNNTFNSKSVESNNDNEDHSNEVNNSKLNSLMIFLMSHRIKKSYYERINYDKLIFLIILSNLYVKEMYYHFKSIESNNQDSNKDISKQGINNEDINNEGIKKDTFNSSYTDKNTEEHGHIKSDDHIVQDKNIVKDSKIEDNDIKDNNIEDELNNNKVLDQKDRHHNKYENNNSKKEESKVAENAEEKHNINKKKIIKNYTEKIKNNTPKYRKKLSIISNVQQLKLRENIKEVDSSKCIEYICTLTQESKESKDSETSILKVPVLMASCEIEDIFKGEVIFSNNIIDVKNVTNRIFIKNTKLVIDKSTLKNTALLFIDGYLKTSLDSIEPKEYSDSIITSSYMNHIIYTKFSLSQHISLKNLDNEDPISFKSLEVNLLKMSSYTKTSLLKENDLDECEYNKTYRCCDLTIQVKYSINIYKKECIAIKI